MFSLRWSRARGVNRGKPGPAGGHGRRLALLGSLIAASLLQTGCQSGPFSPCGCIGRRVDLVMSTFRRDRAAPCCGSSGVVAESGCVPSGVPVESIGVPVGSPVGVPSTVPLTPPATELEPLPSAKPGAAPSSTVRPYPSGSGSSSTGTKTNSSYDALRTGDRLQRGRTDNLTSTLIATPVPADRTAQGSSRTAPRNAVLRADNQGESVLDHLPPLDLPNDVTEKSATPPVAPSARRKPETSTPGPAPASDHLTGRSPRESELNLAAASQPAPEPASPAGGAPGIAQFAAVDLKLAGGSVPSQAGLDWLAEKGYRTLVDLRESSEASPSFIAEATGRGLRYIALPVSLKTLGKTQLDRYNFELAAGDARPLYFFDSKGARAGALWYIRRITTERISSQIAHREAEDLGLTAQDDWLSTTACLERLETPRGAVSQAVKPASTTEPGRASSPAAASSSAPPPIGRLESTAPASEAASSPNRPAPAGCVKAALQTVAAATAEVVARAEPVQPSTPARTQGSVDPVLQPQIAVSLLDPADARPSPAPAGHLDSTAWRPLAALLVTGLTFPLAYWTRSLIPTMVSRTRASLPAPGRRLRSLPRESDA
ncbi:MAG: fused DSP-PTPase phosphatase/NAD kinase-like protein [Isosphaeraceae bacterium]